MNIRPGTPEDTGVVLQLFDDAVAWLVARGQTGQWGTEPFSKFPGRVERAQQWAQSGGLYVAETHEPVGIIVLGTHAEWVEPPERPELYIEALVTSRTHAGEDIGGALVRHAIELTKRQGLDLLRVDCWAGAPGLVAWYERQGFTKTSTFTVRDWHGQVFALDL